MGFADDLSHQLQGLTEALGQRGKAAERFRAEIEFASNLAQDKPEWQALILKAVALVKGRLGAAAAVDPEAAVKEAEAILAPIGKAAKEYTIHCVGHAHIDMNWMWTWPETVSVCYDTFTTMDRLMEQFPEFRFSQSQASVYQAMREYAPELFERIRKRVAEGRWEITASQWVEGDKNLASGEILCRHLLYTKRWMREVFGLPLDAIKIDWECDTFGHPHTLPAILSRGGVRRYYFHRCGVGHRLFWWQSPDGSRILAYDDGGIGYNGAIAPFMARYAVEFERQTGLKDMMYVFGVGDHGGGPTRQAVRAAQDMNTWPIWPNIRFSTTDAFFAIAEAQAKDLPVVDAELQYTFRGCYTSQSNIKFANRTSENHLEEAEAVALIAGATVGFPYPTDSLHEAWRHAMFNQFHDILPGSGVHVTYEHAQGLFQEIICRTGLIRTRGLRALAAAVNTAALAEAPANAGPGLGGGAGEGSWWGGVSTLGAGAAGSEPFLVFNPNPWARSEVIEAKIWNRDVPHNQVVVRDDAGNATPGQVVGHGHYWGHRFITVAFPAREVPGLGYRTYTIGQSAEPPQAAGAWANHSGYIENEFFAVQVEPGSGAITSLVDKRSGYEFVPPGRRIGLLQLVTEAPHGMTAWEIGQIVARQDLTEGATISAAAMGPHRGSITASRAYRDSKFALTISLAAGVPRVDFTLQADWREWGSPEKGVPMLRVAVPIMATSTQARFEVPCGHVERPATGEDVPALKWADISGLGLGGSEKVGACLLNDSKYGCSVSEDEIVLTLIRGSYDPDPLPEMGSHTIRFALVPHMGAWSVSQATRMGYEFNHPFTVAATDLHEGKQPTARGFATLETPNVMLSGLKKAEDSDALIVRLYEMEGRKTEARVRLDAALAPPGSPAVETDLLEQPLEKSAARMEGDTLVVTVPPHGIATVRVG